MVLSWIRGKGEGGGDGRKPRRTVSGEGTIPWSLWFRPQTSVMGAVAGGGDNASRTVGAVGGRESERNWVTAVVQ